MKKVAVILADGYEELEAVTLIDVLRRGGIKSVVVGYDDINVIGAHGIKIVADTDFSEFKVSDLKIMKFYQKVKNFIKFCANLMIKNLKSGQFAPHLGF